MARRNKRASMREGPLSDLFRSTAEDAPVDPPEAPRYGRQDPAEAKKVQDEEPQAAGPVDAGDPPPPATAQGAVPPTTPPTGERRRWLLFIVGFLVVTIAVMTWPAIDPGLRTFYDRTIASQAGRDSPFSLWGQVPSLEPIRMVLLAATGTLAIAFAFIPKSKSLVQLAALSAALLILLQLTLHHWFYLYIVWFYPLLLIALAASPARSSQPAPAR
jgi:hypothetical protein